MTNNYGNKGFNYGRKRITFVNNHRILSQYPSNQQYNIQLGAAVFCNEALLKFRVNFKNSSALAQQNAF